MTGDCMQQLRARVALDAAAPLLDHAQTEVDMSEEAAFVCLPERRARGQLRDAADIVQKRCGNQKIATQPRMQLNRLTANCGNADRMLEQAAGIRMVILRSREPPQ